MPRISEWVVRVTIDKTDSRWHTQWTGTAMELLLEWFRYAGHVAPVEDTDETLAFDIRKPGGIAKAMSGQWARMNADRINSFVPFGGSAKAVPKY